jgi:hypothetical protein
MGSARLFECYLKTSVMLSLPKHLAHIVGVTLSVRLEMLRQAQHDGRCRVSICFTILFQTAVYFSSLALLQLC